MRRKLRRKRNKAMQLNTCKFCLKLYELSHSKVLFVLCYYCCFQVTPNAVQAPLKQFSQCTSPSPLFTPVRFPCAVPVSEPADVLQVCNTKTKGLAQALPPCPWQPPSCPALSQVLPAVSPAGWQSCSCWCADQRHSLVFSYSQVLLEGGTFNREGGFNSEL